MAGVPGKHRGTSARLDRKAEQCRLPQAGPIMTGTHTDTCTCKQQSNRGSVRAEHFAQRHGHHLRPDS